MRGRELLIVVAALFAVAGCQKKQPPPPDQNISIDQPMTDETMANADIETLPPDESSTTPSNQLESGADNPDVNDLNVTANSR
jgi:predicted small lipoprotein YifL